MWGAVQYCHLLFVLFAMCAIYPGQSIRFFSSFCWRTNSQSLYSSSAYKIKAAAPSRVYSVYAAIYATHHILYSQLKLRALSCPCHWSFGGTARSAGGLTASFERLKTNNLTNHTGKSSKYVIPDFGMFFGGQLVDRLLAVLSDIY